MVICLETIAMDYCMLLRIVECCASIQRMPRFIANQTKLKLWVVSPDVCLPFATVFCKMATLLTVITESGSELNTILSHMQQNVHCIVVGADCVRHMPVGLGSGTISCSGMRLMLIGFCCVPSS